MKLQILSVHSETSAPIREFNSRAAHAQELGGGAGEAHAFLLQFERGGLTGPHRAGFGQLFAPLQGRGWVAGADGKRHEVQPGQVAFIARGELHSKGSDEGMTALMVQVRDFAPPPQRTP